MLLLVLLGVTQALAVGTIRHARYECGVHGRFEYCIENSPGCVIGCYCHPGYYFDTDTKVCEHNTKLTSGGRRSDFFDTDVLTTNPPVMPTTLNIEKTDTDLLDNKVDTITKDVDDLSDWLYKQFFKVVENQVINNTDEYELMNRRIGRDSKKYYRKRRSKKRNKKSRMRITEDDSLFDSSDSRSGESDDSDYSDDSWEEVPITTKPKPGPKGNNNHGHRKLVMIHKKPKPPLPSFVFLPDSGTNFYPPVGLQRPPIPMFPIVPVPPVLQPSLFPPPVFLIQQSNDNNNANQTEKPPETCGKNAPVTAVTSQVDTEVQNKTPLPDVTMSEVLAVNRRYDEEGGVERHPPHPRQRAYTVEQDNSMVLTHLVAPFNPTRITANRFNVCMESVRRTVIVPMSEPPSELGISISEATTVPGVAISEASAAPEIGRNGHQRQHRYLKKFQNMRATKNYNKHNMMQPIDSMAEPEYSFLSDQDSPMKIRESLMYETFRKDLGNHYTTESDADIVNFKYLADLIRNVNAQKDIGRKKNNNYHKSNISPIERDFQKNRTFYRNNPILFTPVTEENFYTKLGKEIANLVRKIESNCSGRHEVDIEIVPIDRNTPVPLDNSYVSRSYWDRFARSPNNDITNNHLSNPPMNSNEALNELENIVQRAATVTPELSLTELESLIKMMDKNDPKKDLKTKQPNNIENIKDMKSQPSRINIKFPPNSPPILKVFSDSTLPKPNKNKIRIKTYVTARPVRLNNTPKNVVNPKPVMSHKDDNNRNKKISIRLSRIQQSKSQQIDGSRQFNYYNNKNFDYLMNSRNYNIISSGNQGTKTRQGSIGNWRGTSPLVRAVSYNNVKYFTNSGMQEQDFDRPLEPIKADKRFSSEVVYRNNRPMYFENDFNDFFNI